MTFKRSEYLVETEWLAEHLSDPDLRTLECTIFRSNTDQLDERGRVIRTLKSGREAWAAGHIPGSVFADLIEDLSAPASPLLFTKPSAAQFAVAMSRYGIGDDTRVICYDRAGDAVAPGSTWAARVRWLLRAFGHDNAAVLNGGWTKWTREGRPISTAPPAVRSARFVPRPRPDLFVAKDGVLAAIPDDRTRIVNALTPDLHRGNGPSPYGRPGRMARSVNVPAGHLVDRETQAFLPADDLRAQFEAASAIGADRVITYCGGGIAACSDALILTMLGHPNVAVYDASLSEWAMDDALPMEQG